MGGGGLQIIDISVIVGEPIDPEPEPEPISLTITPETTELNVNYEQLFTATILPVDADQSVTWTVTNITVGSIDENGLFAALAVGNVTITATSVTCANIIGTATIAVIQSEMYWNPWDDTDSEDGATISLNEIVEAIDYWSNDEPVRGHIITLDNIIELIEIWAAG